MSGEMPFKRPMFLVSLAAKIFLLRSSSSRAVRHLVAALPDFLKAFQSLGKSLLSAKFLKFIRPLRFLYHRSLVARN